MFIDCGTCAVRGAGCSDCVVTALLGEPDELSGHVMTHGAAPPEKPLVGVEIGAEQRRAMSLLAEVGLVPELRHSEFGRRVS